MENACYDIPDERDYSYDLIMGVEKEKPSKYIINDNDLQDQNKAGYPYWCVFFSQSQWENIMNYLEWSEVRSKWKDLCDYAESNWMFDPKAWALIINWPKVWKTLWYLSWYFKISTIEELKHSIANNKVVQCGSNSIKWNTATKENWYIVSWWQSYWHSIIIIWYDDDKRLLTIKQSYNKYDNWIQYLRYEDFNLLYPSKFSLVDKTDEKILLYKQKIMNDIKIESAKLFVERGYTNWERPQDNITREEMWAIMERVLSKNNLK